MFWNHRVVREGDELSIREVYYDDNDENKIIGWTAGAQEPYGETLEQLIQDIEWFRAACDLPILVVDPDDSNKLIGVELGHIDYDDVYGTYDNIEDLIADLDSDGTYTEDDQGNWHEVEGY